MKNLYQIDIYNAEQLSEAVNAVEKEGKIWKRNVEILSVVVHKGEEEFVSVEYRSERPIFPGYEAIDLKA